MATKMTFMITLVLKTMRTMTREMKMARAVEMEIFMSLRMIERGVVIMFMKTIDLQGKFRTSVFQHQISNK